jgi:hypothetical protein
MSKPQHKTCLSILRSILGPAYGQEARFAKLINRSPSWLKKASSGIAPLTEDAAVRIAHETGVAVWWLLAGNPSTPAVAYNREPYTKSFYERRRIELREQRGENSNARGDLVLGLHSIIASFHAAGTNADPLVAYKLTEFCRTLREEFGQSDDKKCEKFGLEVCRALAHQIKHPEGSGDYDGVTILAASPKPERQRAPRKKPRPPRKR